MTPQTENQMNEPAKIHKLEGEEPFYLGEYTKALETINRLSSELEQLRKERDEAREALCREQEKLKLSDEKQVRENIAFLIKERDQLEAKIKVLQQDVSHRSQVTELLQMKMEQAEAKCAEMRSFIELWACGCSVTDTELFNIAKQHALSSDCGKGWIKVEELEPTLYVLQSVLIYDKLAGIDSVKVELTRLQQLIERAKQ